MMTLEQVCDWHLEKAENIRRGLSTGYAPEHLRMADAIHAHLSQPQPVAQGEAVACAEVVADPATGNRQVATYFANGVTPEVGTKLYTIPTGHRVVPVDRKPYIDEHGNWEIPGPEPTGTSNEIDHEAIAEVVEEMLSEHPTATSVHEQNEDWADRLTCALQGVKDV